MLARSDTGVDRNVNNSKRDNSVLQSIFDDYERCRIPYDTGLSRERQDEIRHKIENWLFDNEILGAQRIQEIHGMHLTPDEWNMIRDTPDRYWPEVFASRMSEEEKSRVDKGPYIMEVYANPESKHRYYISTNLWTGVAETIYFQNHGCFPSADEEEKIIRTCSGPLHRCFFILTERAAGIPVTYFHHEKNWGEEFINGWRNSRDQYEQEHPAQKKSSEQVAA